jgi:hypothetical protein
LLASRVVRVEAAPWAVDPAAESGTVILYGIADAITGDVEDFYLTRRGGEGAGLGDRGRARLRGDAVVEPREAWRLRL